ncbi:DNA-processing protein DprA [Enterovirga rhinocerotis]|uniref:DNA-processing protein DprA n=1 Tax=Enterovirga rhinocerotis TaxID=1339210 RepID=UPI001FE08AC1|nr:DNA-processing protein DprA [Enterovirga rhinocerotis]
MSPPPLTDEQRLDWLRLIRTERIGPRTFRALMSRHGGAREVLEALPGLARRAGRAIEVTTRAEALREIEAAGRAGIRFVASVEGDYPTPLRAIDTAPPLLAVRGDGPALLRPAVAIVGSRNASAAGLAFTERLAAGLGAAGYVVVSGLARGIDTRAHRAALASGTVAVLAGGHDRIYPSENKGLLERIIGEGGAVVSEMPFGWEPRAQDFPRRNRIVSGLSYGVVVVEAARRSGSLITARLAAEQGREVFAVPGSPLDPRAEGTNDLIRGGATLCADADHVVSALEPLLSKGTGIGERQPAWHEPAAGGSRLSEADRFWDEFESGSDEDGDERFPIGSWAEPEPGDEVPPGDRERVAALLGASPVAIDDLARQAGLPVGAVHSALIELELSGSIIRHSGNAVSLQMSQAVAPLGGAKA